MSSVTAFAPASVGNVAVGFDVLGQALAGPGDRCTARRAATSGVTITAIRGLPDAIPGEAALNTAGRAAQSLLDATDAGFGVELELDKGIPLGSGMGGSAASAVAGAVAVNALLEQPLPTAKLLIHAMNGEYLASGGTPHADNVAPSLYGGLTLVSGGDKRRVSALPVPPGLQCVLIHPHLQIETSVGRAVLSDNLPTDRVIDQIAALGGFIAGCFREDIELIADSLRDSIIEPQRAHMVPGFYDVKNNALDCGALGCSLSGSGPSIFAWTRDVDSEAVASAMQAAFAGHGLASDKWISRLDAPGATIQQQQ